MKGKTVNFRLVGTLPLLLLLVQQNIGTVQAGVFFSSFLYPHESAVDHLKEVDAIIDEYARKMALAGPKDIFRFKKDGYDGARLWFDHARNVLEVAIFYRRLVYDNYPAEEGNVRVARSAGNKPEKRPPPVIEAPDSYEAVPQGVPPMESVQQQQAIRQPPVDVVPPAPVPPKQPKPAPIEETMPENGAMPTKKNGDSGAAGVGATKGVDKKKEPTVKGAQKQIKKNRWNILDKALKGKVTLDLIVNGYVDLNMKNPIAGATLQKTIGQKEQIKKEAIAKFVTYVQNALQNYAKASQDGLLTPEQEQQYIPVLKQFKNGV